MSEEIRNLYETLSEEEKALVLEAILQFIQNQ